MSSSPEAATAAPSRGWHGERPAAVRPAFSPLAPRAADPTPHRAPGWSTGYANGYGSGYAEGLRLVTARAADADRDAARRRDVELAGELAVVRRAAEQLAAAAADLAGRAEAVADDLADVVAGSAVELARGIVGAAAGTPEAVAFRVRRALAELAPAGAPAAVRLHPDDAALLAAAADDRAGPAVESVAGAGAVAGLDVVPDERLGRGDVVATSGASTVSDLLAPAVAAVATAMLAEAAE